MKCTRYKEGGKEGKISKSMHLIRKHKLLGRQKWGKMSILMLL
jgi:hypothetical protein